MEELEHKISELFEDQEEYRQQTEQLFAPMIEGFQKIAYTGVSMLIHMITKDITESAEKLFQKEWYEEQIADDMLATVENYFGGLEGYIMESFFRKLVKI